MKTINLSSEIESKLTNLSQQMGKTEDKLIEEALISYLEDLEDIKDAEERLENPPSLYLTLEEVEKELGLAD